MKLLTRLLSEPENELSEIVFENRNKAYGAYALRQSYSSNLTLSFFISLGFLVLLTGFSLLPGKSQGPVIHHSNRIIDTLTFIDQLDQPDKPEETAKSSAPANEGQDNSTLPPDITNQPVTHPADSTNAGSGSGNQGNTNPVAGGNKGGAGTDSTNSGNGGGGGTNNGNQDAVWVTPVMPEFPGGEDGLKSFLRENITYPEEGKSYGAGRSVRVVVQFVIGKDGYVTGAKVLNKPFGYGFEDEALRVVNKMPRWKPGRQQDREVAVYYTLPIRFEMD